MKKNKHTIIWTLIFCLLSQSISAGEITGTVTIATRKGKTVKIQPQQVIVFLEGSFPIDPKTLSQKYVLSTEDKQFSPQVLPVPKGATVSFPNADVIRHNAFSASSENRFDVGLYGQGKGVTQEFKNPGLVRIYCNVHHSMNAIIYVCDNPYFTYVNPDGSFSLKGVPNGTHQLVVLDRVAGRKKLTVIVKEGKAQPVTVEMVKRRQRKKPHLNKHGKPYSRRKSERY